MVRTLLAVLLLGAIPPLSPSGLRAQGGTPGSEALEAALDRALQSGWEELSLDAECLLPSGFHALSVRGNGVSIWGKKSQFLLTREAMVALLEALREHGFATLHESYGGRRLPERVRQPPKIVCAIRLTLDGHRKEARQLDRGERSEELRRLAVRLFEIARPASESGTGAEDLADGLAAAPWRRKRST